MSESPVAVSLARDVLVAAGPESGPFLQGQLSQDVLGLSDGRFAWSWLLAPNGKVDALLRVTRVSGDDWLLDTDAGWGDPVLARLNRFKLRTKVSIDRSALSVTGLRGAGWEALTPGIGGVVLSPPWPGVEGADVLSESPPPAGVTVVPGDEYEAARILAGIPRMGAELDERTIPGETGLVPLTVSFTKGCYTGQELVARIDSRGGNVPRHLRGLRFPDRSEPVPAGAELIGPDGRPAGTVTSAARSPELGWVGLGYVKRGIGISDVLQVDAGGGPVTQVELSV